MTKNILFEQAFRAHRAGDLDAAERDYRAILGDMDAAPDVFALLGVLLTTKGQFDEALALIETAIRLDPKASLFRLYHGNVLMKTGDVATAAKTLRMATELQPDNSIVHYNLGNAFSKNGAWDDAKEAYHRALVLAPDYAEARNNLALVLEKMGELNLSVQELRRSVADSPDYAEGWLNLCKIAEKNGDFELSLVAGQKAVHFLPQNPTAWLHLGVALNRLDRHQEAEQAYKKAITLRPDWTESWDNLALTFQFMNDLDEAEILFRKVIDLAGQAVSDEDVRVIDERDFGIRHWHLALLELMKGNYERGFGRYRCRFSAHGGLKRMDCPQPYWRGEDIEGKTILIYDEEGFGDGLMMARYLPLLKQRGAFVKFHVKPALGPLFKDWAGADDVTVHGENVGAFDIYCWLFDLPYAFGTTLETIPTTIPYLPVPQLDERTKLAAEHRGEPRIGILWAGSKEQSFYKRQIPLSLITPLFAQDNFAFYSLTRDKRPGDESLLAKYPITDLAPRLRHFGDLARFIMQMDLVITCDTAVPHLAGGLGKEVWTLLPFSCDWRWLTQREDSPWYPTMRLFRQQESGDWKYVVEHVREALWEWRAARG